MNQSYNDFLEYIGVTEEQMLRARSVVEFTEVPSTYYEVRPWAIEGLGVFATTAFCGNIGKFCDGNEWFTLGRYINHSDTPNCYVEHRGPSIAVIADVQKGQELTLNYFAVKDYMEASQ